VGPESFNISLSRSLPMHFYIHICCLVRFLYPYPLAPIPRVHSVGRLCLPRFNCLSSTFAGLTLFEVIGWRGVSACSFRVDPYGRLSINMYSWVLLLVVLGAVYVFLIHAAVDFFSNSS